MICVTGAGGTVGGELIRQLRAARMPFRAAYFLAGKAEAVRAQEIEARGETATGETATGETDGEDQTED